MPPRTRTYTLALTGLLLGPQGCSDDTPTSAGPDGREATPLRGWESNPGVHRRTCRTKLDKAQRNLRIYLFHVVTMVLTRSILLASLLSGSLFSGAVAQQTLPPLNKSVVVPGLESSRAFPHSLYSGPGAALGGIGAVTGSAVVGFPGFLILGLLSMSDCDAGDSEPRCLLPLVPFGVGATLGAGFGAQLGGDASAWKRTAIGAAAGTAFSILVAIPYSERPAAQPPRSVVLGLFILPPAVGAWLGNRLGQPR